MNSNAQPLTFVPLPNSGNDCAVRSDRTLGTARLNRALYSGWIVFRVDSPKVALLDGEGFAAEFDTKEAAGAALLATYA